MADTSHAARTPYAPEEPKPSFLSNILAIIGFVILIVVVIWGLVHLASLSRGWFSSLFGESNAAITVTAPETATSGTAFDITWRYDEPTEGSYAFLYPCQSGFQLQTPGMGGAMNGIPCGAALALANDVNTLSLTPYLTGSDALAVPLSVIFMPNATGTEAQGSATVTVAPSATPAPAPAPAPTPTPTPSYSSSTYSSATSATYSPATPADLAMRIISATVDANGNGTIVFDITNVGGSSSGTYYFTANLPTVSGYAYVSPAQTFMTAGARVRNTLRFTGARSGVATVSITTPDTNAANNHASQVVSGEYYNYNYEYQYGVYPAYQYTYPTYQPQYPYTYQPYPYSTYYPYTY